MIIGGFLFVLGLVIGSAINSFLWRYQTKTTYAGRSMCPVCKHQLSWYDNIPLISWLLLSGKCRYCKKSISVQYPIVEFTTGISFLLIGLYSPIGKYLNHLFSIITTYGLIFQVRYLIFGLVTLLFALAAATALISIAVYDYKTKEIPNGFNFVFIISATLYTLLNELHRSGFNFGLFLHAIWPYLLSAVVSFLFFYSLVFFSQETWMGGGDAKMAFGMGLLLGPGSTFFAILVASITGSVYGIGAILFDRKRSKKIKVTKKISQINEIVATHQVPFGPFLALGTFVAFVFGPQIIDWYVKIILGL